MKTNTLKQAIDELQHRTTYAITMAANKVDIVIFNQKTGEDIYVSPYEYKIINEANKLMEGK